ncbi:hypothetical protein THAOC_31067, partial [Thalassiosira oceanica]
RRQNTCEAATFNAATFNAELAALRTARDLTAALRLKLKVHPIEETPKKHNTINYHVVREAVAMGMIRVCNEDTTTNNADAHTKLMHYDKKDKLFGSLQIK